MPSEKYLIKTLDLLTTAHDDELGALEMAATNKVNDVRNIIDNDNVVGVGVSEKVTDEEQTGQLAVTFYVEKKKPLKELYGHEVIPTGLAFDKNGPLCPTDVVVLGQPELEAFRVQRKPLKPGFSIGHFEIPGGTLGAIVQKKDGTFCLLSNSHVLAKSGTAKKGDKILYPGSGDGGILQDDVDVVAELEDFIEFEVGGAFVNTADCAIAIPLPAHLGKLVAEIEGIGLPTGIVKPKRGMIVTKSGRTTATTDSEIRDTNFRFSTKYPHNVGKVGFFDQVYCTRYTDSGDSGSLVLEKSTGKAVGLHFIGFPDKDGVKGSVFSPIGKILDALGVKLVTKSLPPVV
jgi:hypothetical protein